MIRRTLLCLLIAATACTAAASAHAAVYWGYGSTIGIADLDGQNPHYDLLPNDTEPRSTTCGVAVDDKQLFWAGYFGIGMVDLETRASNSRFLVGIGHPCGIAASSESIFWGNSEESRLSKAKVDGSEVIPGFVSGVRPCDVAVRGGYVYWVEHDSRRIGRARTDGSEVDSSFISAGFAGCALAVDERFVYWAEAGSGAIGRAALDGGEIQPGFITGTGGVTGIATNATHVYWTESNLGGFAGTGAVGRANLDGTDVNRNLITTPRSEIGGIAVDNRPGSLPHVAQSQPIRFGKVRHVRSKGIAFLAVNIPTPGHLWADGSEARWKLIKGKPRPGPQRWQLKIWAGGTGPFAERILRKLNRTGSATVKLFVTFREPERWPISATKRVTLVQPKASRFDPSARVPAP